MGTTRTEELLKFCQTPRSFSELEAAGYNTMRGVVYRLETSGHLARKEFKGRGSVKPTLQWQATGAPYADGRGRRREREIPETGERCTARTGTYVSGAYLRRIEEAIVLGELTKAQSLVVTKIEQAERQRANRLEREAKQGTACGR